MLTIDTTGFRSAAREIVYDDPEWAQVVMQHKRCRPELREAIEREMLRHRSMSGQRGW